MSSNDVSVLTEFNIDMYQKSIIMGFVIKFLRLIKEQQ